MAIRVTPVIFLLDIFNSLTMPILFIYYSAHERLGVHPKNRVKIIDPVNISLAVMLTSFYMMWSIGCLLGSYFGEYEVFMSQMSLAFENLLTMEILIDVFQKAINFLVLAMASFQMGALGHRESLIPWGSTCASIGLMQSIAMAGMLVFFKGVSGWVILYVFSGLVSLSISIFSLLTIFMIKQNKMPENISGYLSNQMIRWNVNICYMSLIAGVLDLSYKAVFVLMEINALGKNQLFSDIFSLAKTASVFITVISVYTSRVPNSKSYSVQSYS
ncbi:hypothetical protein NEIG_01540 [Nematocida sp. ERTm5]|nr:hypothetical protein NEIG_01540 [Nematocida sp. ERTm5]